MSSLSQLASGAVTGTLSTEKTIREALRNDGREGGDESSSISVGDTSMRVADVEDAVGGASRLGKAALGSASVAAALTLHPCVHISGCGDASEVVLASMFSMVGPCRIRVDTSEEGEPTGEASATFESAGAAVAAIEQFDGSRFNDRFLSVSVARTAAQGSFTKRGRSDRMTFYDKQQERMASARMAQAEDEKAAFAAARARVADSSTIPRAPPAVPAFGAQRDAVAAKRKASSATRLPACLVAPKRPAVGAASPATQSAASVASEATVPSAPAMAPEAVQAGALAGGAGGVGGACYCAANGATAPAEEAEEDGEGVGGLLGLAGYGSDSEADDGAA